MRPMFEQIDTCATPIGQVTLRRRRIPGLTDDDIYEVKLGDEFLMSSLFVKVLSVKAFLVLSHISSVIESNCLSMVSILDDGCSMTLPS